MQDQTSTVDETRGRVDPSLAVDKQIQKRKHLIFALGSESFAIPLSQVKEVIGLTNITPIPHAPSYFKGLINLRGRIISIIDIKEKIKASGQTTEAHKPCIIISEVEDLLIGAIVDDVVEVIGIEESQIETKMDLTEDASQDYITGVIKVESKPLTLRIDIGKVFGVQEIKMLRKSTSQQI